MLPGAMVIDLTWSWVYFSSDAGVPGTEVGSRWLECLTPNPHASLFSGSMLPRLHIFMSVLTHSDQVFLGLPLLLALGIVILVMFMHEEERTTCPYHLKRLVRRASVTSCTPNIAQSEFKDTPSSSLRYGRIKLLLAIFVEGHLVTIPAKLFWILTTGFRGEHVYSDHSYSWINCPWCLWKMDLWSVVSLLYGIIYWNFTGI